MDEGTSSESATRRLVLVVDLAGIDLRDDLADADLTRHVELADALQDEGVIGDLARAASAESRRCL